MKKMISFVKFGDPVLFSFFLSFFLALYLCALFSNCETDTLTSGQEMKDGYHLDSTFGVFRLGFFTAKHDNRYLGIWYNIPEDQRYRRQSYLPYYSSVKSEPSPVWVGNTNSPILGKTGALVIASDGNLKIVNGSGGQIAAVNPPVQGVSGKTSAILLDSGNFILRELNPDGSVKRELWQSFDYPTDTLLPGMKLGANSQTGHVWSLKPWLWQTNFTFRLDQNGTTKNQLVILFKGRVYWRSGKWLDQIFPGFSFRNVSNNNNDGEERYVVVYSVQGGEGEDNDVAYPRITITSDGSLIGQGATRLLGCDLEYPGAECSGDAETPTCGVPLYPNDGILIAQGYQDLPPGSHVRAGQCRLNCSRNCTCLAYPRQSPDGSGCQMGIKLAYSAYSLSQPTVDRRRWQLWFIIAGVVPLALFLLLFLSYLGWKWRSQLGAIVIHLTRIVREYWKRCGSFFAMWKEYYVLLRLTKAIADAEQEILLQELGMAAEAKADLDSQENDNNNDFQLFSFEHIVSATGNFHADNKLGQGGFGPVYKGKLPSGLEVAIKRLSTSSRQGLVEFKNEVRFIAKLQHDNLVRLVGCCIENREKILVYEYLPNKSLDFSLFAPTDDNVLDWKKRFNIIQGIAQGLLYLHKYSRLKIVHRDLKASNILLDGEMNPKISDFGLARIFHPNESRAITARVAGTFGYMSPEYAMEGVFSTKSDVFSFGVLLLEIVSGKRNNHFRGDREGPSSLLAWAWELWREGRGTELVDPAIGIDNINNNSVCQNEAVKCIQIGLLCVQENPRDRPSMVKVASMIYNNDSVQLPSPNRPAFYYRMSSLQEVAEIIEEQEEIWTPNQVTITEMNGR